MNPPESAVARAVQALADRLLSVQLLTYLLPIPMGNAEHMWSDEVAAARSRVFLENLEAIRQECVERGVVFIFATQQVKSGIVPAEARSGSAAG